MRNVTSELRRGGSASAWRRTARLDSLAVEPLAEARLPAPVALRRDVVREPRWSSSVSAICTSCARPAVCRVSAQQSGADWHKERPYPGGRPALYLNRRSFS